MSTDLSCFLSTLRAAEHIPRSAGEDWKTLMDRMSVPGKIADIEEDTFFYFLEVLPPKFLSGSVFAFAEGAEPLRLFWRSDGLHFCRQLTSEETKEFCRLAHMSFPYWL